MKDLELLSENETIAERLVGVGKEPKPAEFVVPEIRVKDDAISLDLPSDTAVEVEVTHKIEENIKAKRFLELIEGGGLKDWEAARKMGTTLRQIHQDLPDIRTKVKQLLEKNSFNSAVRKEMVRAALNHILMENVDGNLKQQKVAISAAKEIAKDPDVGLNVPPSVIGVTIDMTALGKLRSDLEPIPGLEKILDVSPENEG